MGKEIITFGNAKTDSYIFIRILYSYDSHIAI